MQCNFCMASAKSLPDLNFQTRISLFVFIFLSLMNSIRLTIQKHVPTTLSLLPPPPPQPHQILLTLPPPLAPLTLHGPHTPPLHTRSHLSSPSQKSFPLPYKKIKINNTSSARRLLASFQPSLPRLPPRPPPLAALPPFALSPPFRRPLSRNRTSGT